jgi:medium-chain acyl-[acyl-carrier-protein] hydrolase
MKRAEIFAGERELAFRCGTGAVMRPGRWFLRSRCQGANRRLFCFSHAGGNARAFRHWQDWFAPSTEVIAVELPGRGIQRDSASVERMELLTRHLVDNIEPLCDLPFAIFGHSIGAAIAYELCRALCERGAPTPIRLFVAGMLPPHLYDSQDQRLQALADDELIEAVRSLNGTPDEVLEHPELLEPFLKVLRSDLRLAESYGHPLRAPLPHAITVFGGIADSLIPPAALQEWALHASAGCQVRLLDGGHFFVQREEHVLAAAILQQLEMDLAADTRATGCLNEPPMARQTS